MESENTTPAQEIETSTSEQIISHRCTWIALINGVRFTNNGRYVCGYVESGQDLMHVLETYRTISGTGFINAQSLSVAMKPFDDTVWQTRFMTPAARPRLFWQMGAGEPHIPYDGVPFMSVGQNTELPCVRYGGRRKKVETVALATGDLINMDFRTKTGCEAKITVRRVMRFPTAQVTDLSQQGVAAVRRMRKQLLEDLTQKIIAGIAKPIERYYFLLPTPLAHSNHSVPEMEPGPNIAQPVTEEIMSQLSHGITEILLIKEHIKNFADASLGNEAALHVENSAYYPSEVCVYHHIYWLYKMGQVIDQESAFKAKLGLSDDFSTSALSLSSTTPSSSSSTSISTSVPTPAKIPVTTDTITSVYSIIMDQSASSPTTSLDLADTETPLQQATDNEVELKTTNDAVATGDGGICLSTESSASPHLTTTPISVPPMSLLSAAVKRGQIIPKSFHLTPLLNSTKSEVATETPPSPPSLVTQSQTEVRDILRILENQTHACKSPAALNTLRRQLTELCSQFSMHLSGVPTKSFGVGANHTPSNKRPKLC